MSIFVKIGLIIIALEHCYFLWLEMFAWTTRAKRVFTSLAPHLFEPTKALAANQGLYNGFLAAGLLWATLITDTEWSKNVAAFFLACVITAGIFGGITASKKIFVVQALPALITMVLLVLL